ncbi:MAG: NADP-dependent oxidoreductase [Rhodospirillales bacterium]|nr:NADP-dependent oxidoreductase [Rhodospirillales bacterium]
MSDILMRRSVVLRRRPSGEPAPDDFEVIEEVVPALAAGEVLVRTIYLSIDPYMRGRLSDRKSYAAPVQIDAPMTGESIGEVVASESPAFKPGDIALGARLWQSHCVVPAAQLTPIARGAAPLSAYLGVLGMPGTTAYSGMKDIGQPKPGETVVISAASGAVGSVAGQLAKRAGARVVGVAGGPDKCLWVQEALGFDACVDHRVAHFSRALADTCPAGIDVYFENVGGAVQQAAFAQLNTFGRMVMCGMVAQYNDTELQPGPNLMSVVGKRLRIEGLIVSDKPERFAEWRALAAPWVQEGSLRWRETVIEGLESAPEALRMVLRGANFGKMVVRVGPE